MSDIVLDVDDVSFRYGNQLVLNQVSFQLKKGEMLGLVGPNGSGKSTLLKVLLGLLPNQSGSISWFDTPHQRLKNRWRIGYVSQKANSFNSGFPATVQEVVLMGLTGKLGLFCRPGKVEKEKVYDAIARVGLSGLEHRNIGKLSGGQQQRVFIARALVGEPEVLILDEPTVGVDARSENEFYDLLKSLNIEKNISLILVTHDMGVVSKKMQSIACLNHKLHFHGKAEEFERRRPEILLRSYGHDVHILQHSH